MGIHIVEKIDDLVKIKNVLVSVSDKKGLEGFIPGLLEINPEMKFFSTGGTHARISSILGEAVSGTLTQVADYTGQPETQGGLVKTLDFKIYLGLLTESHNAAHRKDLQRTGAVPIDMVVVNLYPFRQTVSRPEATVEEARGNIDIGGPCMIRAGAKNFLRVASVVDPADYPGILTEMKKHGGATTLEIRYRLAQKAFAHTAIYDREIADFLMSKSFQEAHGCYHN
jgi:phosphoribosylaminoimidazolecarboxamide formyltransferase/IMP cyclohydrolase